MGVGLSLMERIAPRHRHISVAFAQKWHLDTAREEGRPTRSVVSPRRKLCRQRACVGTGSIKLASFGPLTLFTFRPASAGVPLSQAS